MSMRLIKSLFVFLTVMGFWLPITAQRNTNTPPPTSVTVPNDTTSEKDNPKADTVVRRNTFFSIFNGNPGKAALYSLILPAGGQAYNKKWFKIPLALGIDGAAIGWIVYNKGRYNYYDGIFRSLLAGETNQFFRSPSDVNVIRKAYKSRVEYAWVYFGIAHLVTVFDAFVDRHLIEFDIENDIVYNSPLNTANAFEIVSIKIPLSKFTPPVKPKFIYLAE